jgi:hypothetical protein
VNTEPRLQPFHEDAVALGIELAQKIGTVWEQWTEDKPFVQAIIREAELKADAWAWGLFPMQGWWFANARKIKVYVLAPLGILLPLTIIAVLTVIEPILDGFDGYVAVFIALFVLAVWFPQKALESAQSYPENSYSRLRATLIQITYNSAYNEIQKVRYKSESSDQKSRIESVDGKWTPIGPRPAPLQFDVSPQEAECYVEAWLRFLGVVDSEVTQYSQDGGVDIESSDYVVQVKHLSRPVSVQPIRELFGVAASKGKGAVFFSRSGYTKDALRFAEDNRIIAFEYKTNIGHLVAHSSEAYEALENGLA